VTVRPTDIGNGCPIHMGDMFRRAMDGCSEKESQCPGRSVPTWMRGFCWSRST
jgi:hypothetical protein